MALKSDSVVKSLGGHREENGFESQLGTKNENKM